MEDWECILNDKKENTERDDSNDACATGNMINDENWSEVGQVQNITPKCMYLGG